MDEAETDQSRTWKWVVQQKKFLRILWKIGVLGKPEHIDFVKVGSVNIDEIVEFACGSAPLKSIEPTYNLCEQVGKLKSH
jgi:hypothetical protein